MIRLRFSWGVIAVLVGLTIPCAGAENLRVLEIYTAQSATDSQPSSSPVASDVRPWVSSRRALVEQAKGVAREMAIPATVFLGIIHQESRFRPHCRGAAGEYGLTQILPSTFRLLKDQGRIGGDPLEPDVNLRAGAIYLRDVMGSLTLWDLVLSWCRLGLTPSQTYAAGYNAGIGRLHQAIAGTADLPTSTVRYAKAAAKKMKGREWQRTR